MRLRSVLFAFLVATLALHGLEQGRADLIVHGITVGLAPGRYDRFAGDPSFIGAGIDWSGIGRATASSGGPGWATMISPSFFVTADHTVDDVSMGAGKTLRFYANNNANSAVDRTIAEGWPLGNDLWLGRLTSPVPNTIHPFPILNIQNPADYVGQEIYVYGQSADIYGNRAERQRLGRNVISSYSPTSQAFGFTYSASVADIAGPDGVSDGVVDSYDWNVFQANFGIGNPTHLDGDVNDDGDIDLDDGRIIFDEGIRMTTVSGWIGLDEAITQGGDSGGPSFRLIDGKPAIVGTHWGSGSDRLVSASLATIADLIDTASGETEQLVSLTGKRGNFFSSKDNLSLPAGLQKLNIFRADLNGDFVENAADIDFLNGEIQSHIADPLRPVNWALDLDDDGDVDADDRTIFLEQAMGTYFGDLTLDGKVTLNDDAFVAAANVGLPPSQWPNSSVNWINGDYDGDGSVSVSLDISPSLAYVNMRGIRSVVSDYNNDGDINDLDIDLLAAEARAGTNNALFDVTRDGFVDMDDYDFFVSEILGTLVGDVNLDGAINITLDILPIMQFVNTQTNMWSKGDVNGDGWTDQDDLDIMAAAIQSGNRFAPPPGLPGLPIPEPTGLALLFTAIAGLMTQRRRIGV